MRAIEGLDRPAGAAGGSRGRRAPTGGDDAGGEGEGGAAPVAAWQADSFFVAFARVKAAAAAAAHAQRTLAAHEWPRDVVVGVRMGLHAGEPLLAEERYVGLGVHRAARICAVAHGGQVLLSQ